jgi:hypothetical protein
VYYLADEREPPLQRSGLAREIARALPGFEEVRYPDWDSLFQRWWNSSPPGRILVLDEFPLLVSGSRELPGILQGLLDRGKKGAPSLILCGSSQAMMQGLVLDGSAPLYGRAREILKVGPKAAQGEAARLVAKSPLFPLAGGRRIHCALWLRERPRRSPKEARVFTPAGVLRALR